MVLHRGIAHTRITVLLNTGRLPLNLRAAVGSARLTPRADGLLLLAEDVARPALPFFRTLPNANTSARYMSVRLPSQS